MFYVVSYDIAADDRRNRAHATLKDYGTPVQYSVFECDLDAKRLIALRTRQARLIDPKEDNVRYYRICKDCLAQTVVVGERSLTTDTDHWLV
jgi:CRISPR-associated protein Cas2